MAEIGDSYRNENIPDELFEKSLPIPRINVSRCFKAKIRSNSSLSSISKAFVESP